MSDLLTQAQLIQGGMGVYVSNWRLARAVATARLGKTVGTVSGTALDIVYVRLLQLGDPGGHIRRAFAAFDAQFGVSIGAEICARYFIPGGKSAQARFKPAPIIMIHSETGEATIPAAGNTSTTIPLSIDPTIIELQIITGFAEVWLAKEGHSGNICINFLNKIEIPLLYIMYGAMLAGVDGIIVGAGNPEGLPAMCSRLAKHEPVTRDLAVLYQATGERFILPFDPRHVRDGALTRQPLRRPAFLAIVTHHDLAQALATSSTEAPDGFIIENHTAGGHNANPLGPLRRDENGQPIYTSQDRADLTALRELGKPFWLAGGYGNHSQLLAAQALGAVGIQAGSIFALAEESGMQPEYRSAILQALRQGMEDTELVRTTLFSPTGFAFKVAQIDNTLADDEVFNQRKRICDIGLLQQVGLTAPDAEGQRKLFQRCAAAPIPNYVSKRGLVRNAEDRRCLCNGLLACTGLGQTQTHNGQTEVEPAIVTLGDHLDGIRRLSRNGQTHYWAKDAVDDILGGP